MIERDIMTFGLSYLSNCCLVTSHMNKVLTGDKYIQETGDSTGLTLTKHMPQKVRS